MKWPIDAKEQFQHIWSKRYKRADVDYSRSSVNADAICVTDSGITLPLYYRDRSKNIKQLQLIKIFHDGNEKILFDTKTFHQLVEGMQEIYNVAVDSDEITYFTVGYSNYGVSAKRYCCAVDRNSTLLWINRLPDRCRCGKLICNGDRLFLYLTEQNERYCLVYDRTGQLIERVDNASCRRYLKTDRYLIIESFSGPMSDLSLEIRRYDHHHNLLNILSLPIVTESVGVDTISNQERFRIYEPKMIYTDDHIHMAQGDISSTPLYGGKSLYSLKDYTISKLNYDGEILSTYKLPDIQDSESLILINLYSDLCFVVMNNPERSRYTTYENTICLGDTDFRGLYIRDCACSFSDRSVGYFVQPKPASDTDDNDVEQQMLMLLEWNKKPQEERDIVKFIRFTPDFKSLREFTFYGYPQHVICHHDSVYIINYILGEYKKPKSERMLEIILLE